MLLTILFISVNTPKVQDFIKQSFIDYLNIGINNNLIIENSSFNINGEVVFNDIYLSSKDSDTLLYLETLKTNFLPLITNSNLDNSLSIDGLDLIIDITGNEIKMQNENLEQIINEIFFDRLKVINSSIIIKNDSIQNFIKIDNLVAQEIKTNDELFFQLSNFSGEFNETKVDNFISEITYDDLSFNLTDTNLKFEDQFINGDISFELDSKYQLNRFKESFFEFYLESDNFQFLEQFFNENTAIRGDIFFKGLKDDITFEKFDLKTELFEFKSKGSLKGDMSNEFDMKIDLVDITINDKKLLENTDFKGELNIPILDGNIYIDNESIKYSFSQQNNYNSKININGNAIRKDEIMFDFNVVLDLQKDEKLISPYSIDNLKFDSRFQIKSNDQINIDADFQIFKNNNYFDFDVTANTLNNYLSSSLEIRSKDLIVESKIYGNLQDKKIESISSLSIENFSSPDINNIRFSMDLQLDYSFMDNIESILNLNEINIETSDNSFYFLDLNEINEILGYDFINEKRKYDISLNINDNKLSLKSALGSNILIDGFYKNDNDLDMNIKVSDLFIESLYEINKNSISGNIQSKININRSESNRTLTVNTALEDLKIKEYNIGDLEINAFGNTDYNSYSIDFKLLNQDKTSIESEGTLIAINEKPNLDLDVKFNDFDISFIEKVGSNTLNKLSSSISGQVNLWGGFENIQHNGTLILNNSKFSVPYLNIEYMINDNSEITLFNQNFEFKNILINDSGTNSSSLLNGKITHSDYKDWNLDLVFSSDRLFIINKDFTESEKFYGKAFIDGEVSIFGPTNQISLNINAETESGTYITIPRSQSYSIENFSFIEFNDINRIKNNNGQSSQTNNKIPNPKSFDLEIDLTLNNKAVVDITIDQETGSYISGSGNGNLFMEIDSEGEFNIFGDFITTEGVYNFKDLALIDKKFKLNDGGTIIWDGDPLNAQMNISAIYEVPGGANPALLLDNPNFNKKIPTDLEIKLTGDLTKPNSPDFEIYFPNTSSTVTSEINYKLNDPEVRQLQAISLLTQGIFINEVSVSIEGITNNIYEKVSDVFSEILGGSQGPLKVGLNYLQGDKSEILDIKTEDRFGVTLSTEISDKILFNGKIGVPIGGIEETLIIGDVQIDFILNEDNSLKAKVFNRENEFRYIGDKLGYTQGLGITYQVDFQTFRDLISKLIEKKE